MSDGVPGDFPGLSGRAALVTGGSRGIGAEIARALAARGATVVVAGRDTAAIGSVVEGIAARGGTACGLSAELTDPDAVDRLRRSALDACGPIELLVACAGGGGPRRPLVEETPESWRQTLDGNLTSAFLTLRAFLPDMCERRAGAIVM